MDKLKAMTTFVRIVEAGSLTAAAESLGRSTASAARTLAALEGALGLRLINRNTRRLALTDEGAEYLVWCRRMLAEFEAVEQGFEAKREAPGGLLRLTAPAEFGALFAAPVVNAFLRAHPAMSVELLLFDRLADLLEEGLDLAIRIGPLPDSEMVATRLGETRFVTCVSPELLRRTGPIRHPSRLREIPCVGFHPPGRVWSFQEAGAPLTVEIAAVFSTNQARAARLACVEGLGVARLLHYQVAQALEEGRLLRILEDFETPGAPVRMVYPHARLLSPRVRRFIDWAAPRLGAAIPRPGLRLPDHQEPEA